MIWFDPVYFWYVLIPVLIISLGVQIYLRRTYAKWSNIRNSSNLSGIQVGNQLFKRTSLQAIPLQRTKGELTDHYDPGANVVRLSESTADKHSVSAMAVTAHELGHVQQYQTGSAWIKVRGFLLPALQFSPTISYLAILFGLIFNIVNLIYVGIIFFALMVIFSILTIPVEVNASRRGRRLLREADLMKTKEDDAGSRAVLNAAALTYLAAAITSILQLLYYISLAQRRS
jgi:Zn-dependent membrane protease YugP